MWLAKQIEVEINNLLQMSYNTARYGMILHENIGRFKIICDMITYSNTIDVGEVIGPFPST